MSNQLIQPVRTAHRRILVVLALILPVIMTIGLAALTRGLL